MYHEIRLSEDGVAQIYDDGGVVIVDVEGFVLLTDAEMRELVAGWVELQEETTVHTAIVRMLDKWQ